MFPYRSKIMMRLYGAIGLLLGCAAVSVVAEEGKPVDFARDVRPILEKSCGKCHGPEKQQGGLRFDRADGVARPADSGKKPVIPGKAAESELIRRVEAADKDERMPPESEPLSREQIAVLRAWIEQGAKWPEDSDPSATGRRELVVTDEDRRHWSYLPLHAVDTPAVSDANWCGTPIDRFILMVLEARGIKPSPPAERQTLIRRAYFDVMGLPPSPDEVEAFVADASPDAYEKLVDRLLASPRYGERWGRHWLDLARYADSGGMETDADRPNAYHYRDFVIRALNQDLSYQTFARWQLAGDAYDPDNPLALSATGFLTGAPNEMLTDQHLEEERLRLRFNELDDMAVTTSLTFLGLTLGCARCHDHKFDAIPTRDYYRLQAAFMTTARGDVFLASRAEAEAYRQAETQWKKRLEEAKKTLPQNEVEAIKRSQPQAPLAALAITDKKAEPEPTWLLNRGDFYAKKEQVQLGFFTVLSHSKSPEDYLAAARTGNPVNPSTLQRRALADWMTDAEQGAGPLLARVMVNRVWQHHFGEGLSRTVSDFGVRGERPTHPELLEWLTYRFVARGWQLKELHRSILNSSVYRQATVADAERSGLDPDNRLLWRQRPKRLEAEILRDAVLSVSGTLNLQQFGPAFKPPIPSEAIVARNAKDPYPKDARDTPETRRRTVYMFHKRVVQHPLMQAFDGPDAAVSCGRRNSTTVAPQALALLNDPFLRDRAGDFARSVLSQGSAKPEDWATSAFRLALVREPRDSERLTATQFLEQQLQRRAMRDKSLSAEQVRLEALTDFCQALFSLNEFIYVD